MKRTLLIKWASGLGFKEMESFKNIKTFQKARGIISRRNKKNIQYAIYEGVLIYGKL